MFLLFIMRFMLFLLALLFLCLLLFSCDYRICTLSFHFSGIFWICFISWIQRWSASWTRCRWNFSIDDDGCFNWIFWIWLNSSRSWFCTSCSGLCYGLYDRMNLTFLLVCRCRLWLTLPLNMLSVFVIFLFLLLLNFRPFFFLPWLFVSFGGLSDSRRFLHI